MTFGRTMRVALLGLLSALLVWAAMPVERAAAAGGAITGAASGLCLDVRGESTAAGADTIIWACRNQANQRWSLTAAGELRVYDDTQCLRAENNGTTAGTRSVIAACDGTAGQKWRYTGGRTLVHTSSGLCLDVRGAAVAENSDVRLWTCHGRTNQQWEVAVRPADASPPTAPSGLRASALRCDAVTLTWNAATDDVGVVAYDIYHDGQKVTTVDGSTLTARVEVRPGVTWGWYVNARDAAERISPSSATLSVTPPQCTADTTPPSTPTDLTASASGTSVTLRWTAATDNVGVSDYDIRRDGQVVTSVPGSTTTYTDSALAPNRRYAYAVVARDAQDNVSPPSTTVEVTTGNQCGSAICSVAEVARDRDIPWGLVTLPDGSVLYSRRDAHEIVRLNPATGATQTLGKVPNASGTDGEGGVMGLAIAANFSSDPWLYVMHTTPSDNRVVRIRYRNGALEPGTTDVLLSGILRSKYHNGGRLRFGPDGMLYAATGDAENENYAQVRTGTGALNGKILRMTPAGDVPSDNPFGSYIWTYGHRNPQGLAFDSRGRLWQQEFGNGAMDETNLVQKGGNYGWPQCEGTSGSGCGNAGLIAPKRTYRTVDASCSGLTVVRDVVYVACGRGERLYRLVISGDSLTDVQQYFVGTYGRLRTVEPTADGGLWLTTTTKGDKDSIPNNSDERIFKITLGG